jgi:hypothetical protein
MIPKIIGIVVGKLAVGIFAWKFKKHHYADHESCCLWD